MVIVFTVELDKHAHYRPHSNFLLAQTRTGSLIWPRSGCISGCISILRFHSLRSPSSYSSHTIQVSVLAIEEIREGWQNLESCRDRLKQQYTITQGNSSRDVWCCPLADPDNEEWTIQVRPFELLLKLNPSFPPIHAKHQGMIRYTSTDNRTKHFFTTEVSIPSEERIENCVSGANIFNLAWVPFSRQTRTYRKGAKIKISVKSTM